jgi:hypothetical protein
LLPYTQHIILHISFSRIKALHSLVIARHQSVKILQIESKKITKADRIKKLHFENKYMYGSKINEKKKKEVSEPVDVEALSNKDISSEIYWTCLHVPEVQDFTTKPKKVKGAGKKQKKLENVKEKKTKVEVEEVKKAPKIEKEKSSKTSKKTIVLAPEVLLPASLANLENNLSSVTAEIKEKLSENFKIRLIESEKNGIEKEIPFDFPQLREIPNFPMTLTKNTRILTEFEKFVTKDSTIIKPSVSKVLQATIPENQRKALMHWKNLKITELGLEGFDLMQKCKFMMNSQKIRKITYFNFLQHI